MASSKADEVWRALQSSAAPKKASSIDFNKLWFGFNSDVGGKAAMVKAAGKPPAHHVSGGAAAPAASQTAGTASNGGAGDGGGASQTGAVACRVSAAAGRAHVVDPASVERLLQRCCGALQDTAPAARRRALQDIKVGPVTLAGRPGPGPGPGCRSVPGT